MKRRKALNTIAVIIVMVGGLLLIGSEGAVKQNAVPMGQALAQIGAGVGVLIAGGWLFKKTYNPNDYNYEEVAE